MDLVSTNGGVALPADEHPLTRGLFDAGPAEPLPRPDDDATIVADAPPPAITESGIQPDDDATLLTDALPAEAPPPVIAEPDDAEPLQAEAPPPVIAEPEAGPDDDETLEVDAPPPAISESGTLPDDDATLLTDALPAEAPPPVIAEPEAGPDDDETLEVDALPPVISGQEAGLDDDETLPADAPPTAIAEPQSTTTERSDTPQEADAPFAGPVDTWGDIPRVTPRESLPGAIRALGTVNLILSLLLPPNPLGVVGAIGLLKGRAWGWTLSLAWTALEVIFIVLAWFGLAAALVTTGGFPGAIGKLAPGITSELNFLIFALIGSSALAVYLIFQWGYLSRPDLAARFEGGGARTGAWAGWLFGLAYLAAAVLAGQGLLAASSEDVGRVGTGQEQSQAPGGEVDSQTAPEAQRVTTTDSEASMKLMAGWKVTSPPDSEDIKLGVLLKGRRENPAGTFRLSTARPKDLARLNKRFDSLEADGRTIHAVEEVTIGDLQGRMVVMASPIKGGLTGQIMLSLHDDTRAFQFACAAPGPGFQKIWGECEAMAISLQFATKPASATAG